jgi:hypothetical protein
VDILVSLLSLVLNAGSSAISLGTSLLNQNH